MTKYSNYVIKIKSDGFPTVIALLDAAPTQVTGGHGGWTTTARQRRIALTQWQGNDPIRIAIPILFDSKIDHISNQKICMQTLAKLGLPGPAGGEPPIIFIDGPGDLVQATVGKSIKHGWVIESLTWGTNVRREIVSSGLGSLRQDVIVNLIEYVDEDRVAFANLPSISKSRGKSHKKKKKRKSQKDGGQQSGKNTHGWPKWYHPKPGETLPKIAAKFYHDSSMWHRIAEANGIRDPSNQFGWPWLLLIPAP